MPSRKKGAKRGAGGAEPHAAPGRGGPGRAFQPTQTEEDLAPAEKGAQRAVPAPGVPVSDRVYEMLKEKAKTQAAPPSKHAQEDSSAKPRK
jgi:hypothetical protein